MTDSGHTQSDLTLPSSTSDLDYVLFGLECGFTAHLLLKMVESGRPPIAILLPGPPRFEGVLAGNFQSDGGVLSMADQPNRTVSSIASERDIPCLRAGKLSAERTRRQIAAIGAHLAITACFNRRIPQELLCDFQRGGINVHPSLLPDLRGPDPLFWTLQRADRSSGITIHQMSERFDAGAILSQIGFEMAEGVTESQLEHTLAELAADLLALLLGEMAQGEVKTVDQDGSMATYARHPEVDDFAVPPDFGVSRAFNFVRGVAGRGVPFRYRSSYGKDTLFTDALAHRRATDPDKEPAPKGARWLEFSDGYLLAVIYDDSN